MSDLISLPKISAFIIVYNQENYIRETINSVLDQNYPNLEIVIGDDCSTDNTVAILKDYKLKYPKTIKLVLSSKNEGITSNCNKVLKECTGEYIAILGGDDIWLPNKLNKQIKWFEKNPDGVLCYTHAEVFKSETNKIISNIPVFTIDELNKFDTISKAYHLGSSGSSFLIKKNAIPDEGFNRMLPMVSDWLFYIQIMHKNKIGGIDEILMKYRRHDSNTSNNLSLIFNEHYITLQIVKNLYPDLRESVREWETTTLKRLCLLDDESISEAINPNNAFKIWKKASDNIRISKVISVFFLYIIKRIFLTAKLKTSHFFQ